MKPIFVFDGKPPTMKRAELTKRSDKRGDADAGLAAAKEAGDDAAVEKFAKRTVKVWAEGTWEAEGGERGGGRERARERRPLPFSSSSLSTGHAPAQRGVQAPAAPAGRARHRRAVGSRGAVRGDRQSGARVSNDD